MVTSSVTMVTSSVTMVTSREYDCLANFLTGNP